MAKSALRKHGRGLIHSIGRNHPGSMSAWIERRIFPGAHPPCLSEMMQIFEPHNFSVLDVENLRLHYARTRAHWLERFEANADKVEQYKAGKEALFGFFVGQTMKAMAGKANPQMVNERLRAKLD